MRKTDEQLRILIVEDDYQLASEWQEKLHAHGFLVDVVSNADDAILLLPNNYDCFIIDLFHVKNDKFLPDGGINCIGYIKRHNINRSTKSLIITVTGHFRDKHSNSVATDQVTRNLGADYTLKKPIGISTLLDIIENWKDSPSS